jgi:hypothetical protein
MLQMYGLDGERTGVLDLQAQIVCQNIGEGGDRYDFLGLVTVMNNMHETVTLLLTQFLLACFTSMCAGLLQLLRIRE